MILPSQEKVSSNREMDIFPYKTFLFMFFFNVCVVSQVMRSRALPLCKTFAQFSER